MTDEKQAPERRHGPAPSADTAGASAAGRPAGQAPAGPADDRVPVQDTSPRADPTARADLTARADTTVQVDPTAPSNASAQADTSAQSTGVRRGDTVDREDVDGVDDRVPPANSPSSEGVAAVAAPVPARSVTEREAPLPSGPIDDGPAVTGDPHAERSPVVAVASERGGAAPVEDGRTAGAPAEDSATRVLPAPEEPRAPERTENLRPDGATRVLPAPGREEPRAAERTELLRTDAAPLGAPAAAPLTAPTAAPEPPRTVYVEAPAPPKRKGNRVFGVLLSLLSAAVFALVWAGVVAVIIAVGAPDRFGQSFTSFLASWAFWLPVIGYALGMVLLALMVGRGGWAWWLVGGFLVAVLVYFAYLGGALLTVAAQITAAEVQGFLQDVALTPLSLGAAVAAREVSIWTGLAVAARGRKVKARNTEARAAFDREQAERRAAQPA